MKTGEKGFTLAELLIALALLGVIAAFTIPKIFQAQGNREQVSKVREVVASMEEIYYGARDDNSIVQNSNPFLDWLVHPPKKLNALQQGKQDDFKVDDTTAGQEGPLANATRADGSTSHPCGSLANAVNQPNISHGWAQFSNGLVITGLASQNAAHNPDDGSPTGSTYGDGSAGQLKAHIYTFCIDTNGASPPNSPGQDVFFTNFSHQASGTAFFHNGDPDGTTLGVAQYTLAITGGGTQLKDGGTVLRYWPPAGGPPGAGAAAVGQLLVNR